MRCVLIWRDIGGYHAARSRAANDIASLSVDTIEMLDRPEYPEFRAPAVADSPFTRHDLGLAAPLRAAAARRALHAKLDQVAPDVVFTPGWSMLESLLAIEWCVLNSIPLVIMSESTRDDAIRSSAREHAKRRVVALASAALVGGRPQADYLAELGLPRERIFLGYDAVDNDHFAGGAEAARAAKAAPPGIGPAWHGRTFLASARFVPKKNLPRLVEAFHRYRQAAGAAAWPLVLLGDGPMRAELERRRAALGLKASLAMPGFRPYAELPLYYGAAGAFVLASTTEQWGLVVNEAMASGLPVLVSDRCGCAPDLVETGRNGYTFDPHDADALARLMLEVASDACDRAAMGAASRAIVARWGPDRFAAGFEAAARAALAAPERRASVADRMLLRALAWR
jgi:glycosyltransferase involved in cell wall biosynthesis